MQLTGCLSRNAQVARQVGRDVLSCLQFRTISYQEFVQELERTVDLAGYLGVGIGRHACPLSTLPVEFSAHLLNAVGVCTERVKDKLVRADCHGKFRWEPNLAELVPVAVADDSSDEFVPALFAPAAVPTVALPPVSVPVTIGVGAGQRQVLTVPTAEIELQSIREHVTVSNACTAREHVGAPSKWVYSES